MNKPLERKNQDKVLRQLGRLLPEIGFRRTKPTFFTRPRGLVVEFVHLHKYTFAAEFRIHLGLRVTNDGFDAAALNGPDSLPYVCKGSPSGRQYNFRFHEAAARDLARFVARVAAQAGVAAQEIDLRTLDLALAAFLRRDRLFRSAPRDPRLP
jgi:hypothetical protein